jgi:mannose-1-phosphate guanylyltransferase
MKVETCLILSAGFGTRMGEIGKVLPKVLWPVFEKSLLEVQIKYARSLGCKNIYINTHYLADKIKEHLIEIGEVDNVRILNENPILDSGGAIHNLAKQDEINYKGKVLLLNGDQFLFLNKEQIEDANVKMDERIAHLFAIKVDKNTTYNETRVNQEGILKEICKPNNKADYLTYSGVGIINLEKLERVDGESKFFETVAPIRSNQIGMQFVDGVEYWDFGTSKRYKNSIYALLNKKGKSRFYDFLISNEAINPSKITDSYYSLNKEINSIVLDESFTGTCENSIILKNNKENKNFVNKLVYGNITQELD